MGKYECRSSTNAARASSYRERMYGMIVVDPASGRSPAREYFLVQSEFYADEQDILDVKLRFVVFSGQANRYVKTPVDLGEEGLCLPLGNAPLFWGCGRLRYGLRLYACRRSPGFRRSFPATSSRKGWWRHSWAHDSRLNQLIRRRPSGGSPSTSCSPRDRIGNRERAKGLHILLPS